MKKCNRTFLKDLNLPGCVPDDTYLLPPHYDLINGCSETSHDTALSLAAAEGHVELVKYLLSRGAETAHRNKKGKMNAKQIWKLGSNINSFHILGSFFF